MSAEEDLKRLEAIADAVTLRIVKGLTKHTIIGLYYAFLGEAVKPKIASILRSNKSTDEQVEEILKVIKEAQESRPVTPPPGVEEEIRRIVREAIREEVRRMEAGQARGIQVQAQAPPYPAQRPQAPSYSVQRPVPPRSDVDTKVQEIDEEIKHYKSIRRKLEEKYYLGEISEEDYLKKKADLDEKIRELKMKKERLLTIYY